MSTGQHPGAPLRVAIVGGGIAGLAVARALQQRREQGANVEVVVLERADRAGGNIRTDVIDGYICEWGPNGFLDNAPATMALVADLGLQNRLQPADASASRRFIVRHGRLYPVPGNPLQLASTGLLSWTGKGRVVMEPFAPRRPDGDETIHAFAARRLGEEAADVLVDSMVSGVFGGDARQLSLRACFPKMWQLEQDHGGLVRALLARRRSHPRRNGEAMGSPLGRLTSFRGGSEELVRALVARLGDIVQTGVDVQHVWREADGRYRLDLAGTASIVADRVIFASGATTTARIVQTLEESLAGTLREMPTAGLAVVCLGYVAARLPRPLDGFGYLVPRREGLRTLGCLWDSTVYPGRAPAGRALMRVMIGGATDPAVLALSDAALLDIVRTDLRTVMGIDADPELVRIIRHSTGIPQYTVGHLDRLARAESTLSAYPGVVLAGNSYRGVSINACIAEAASIAERVLQPRPNRVAA